MKHLAWMGLAAALCWGCGDDDGGMDAGSDAPGFDAAVDVPGADVPGEDAGPEDDAGDVDSGPRADANFPDGGPFEGDHAYFDFLVAQPEHYHSRAYRSMEQIIEDSGRTRSRVDYDPAQDAARWTFGPDVGSMTAADQLRTFFEPLTEENQNAFYTWEGRWSALWMTNRGGIETHKAFQIGGIEGGRTPRGLEPRTRFSRAMDGFVASTDCRIYGWSPSAPGPADTFADLDAEFDVAPETWTRYWMFIDWENLQVSMWVGDETRAPIAIYDRSEFNSMSPAALESFWFEFNSSQSRSDPETLYTWGRNLVVLRNIAGHAAALSLVEQGDQTR